jgi:hypothetical protein
MRPAYRAAGIALVVAGMWAVASGSTAPTAVHGSDHGVLRLAWSVRPERVEVCREQTPEELAKLPQHMRQPVLCEGSSAQYRLTVRYGGQTVVERDVRGGGLRRDRRVYVFHEVPLEPGEASIEVRFDRSDAGPSRTPFASSEQSPAEARGTPRHIGGAAAPAQLSLEQRLRVRPREVILITYSPELRMLVAVRE